jgi:bifunctional NMN adenylyltransferase/nudix hydrolase
MGQIHNSIRQSWVGTPKHDVLVLIGRFQPFGRNHLDMLRQAVAKRPRKIIILVGSAKTARSPRNPFTYAERYAMIHSAIVDDLILKNENIVIRALADKTYDNEGWVDQVNEQIYAETTEKDRIAIFGHPKDVNTQWYLDMFGPLYDSVTGTPFMVDDRVMDASTVRAILFNPTLDPDMSLRINSINLAEMLPISTQQNILSFARSSAEYLVGLTAWNYLRAENEFILNFRKSWAGTPYPPIFHTVDSVIYQNGHILMVERGEWPGKGLLAFPGGYIREYEWPIQAALRELDEETGIKVSKRALMGALKRVEQFADPHRSLRGRFFTDAHLFHLDPRSEFPRVKGADDAAGAAWTADNSIQEELCFEDHFFIKNKMRGYLRDQPV